MITEKLRRRQTEGNPIRVGWVGAGRMNTGAICQVAQMQGIRNAVICDLRPELALRAFRINGWAEDAVTRTDNVGIASDAIKAGRPVVTADSSIMPELDLDCVVEGTGDPEVGVGVAYSCIQAGRNVVLLNVETDVVVGPILHQMAERAGVIYTVSSGDEPGLLTELVDRYGGLGFEVVAVGKSPASLGKMDLYANPDTVAEDARELAINPHFLVTFRDATKTAIEMSAIANATGLVPDVRGMHGPVAGIHDMAKLFRLKEEGGILGRRGVVDYARPLMLPDGSIDFDLSVTPGVFLVLRTTHEQLKADLGYWNVVHEGDYFTFHTPYHLATNELPLSIVWAVEDREPTCVPRHGLVAEVIGAAKRDLHAGDVIDGAGGFTVYAINDLACVARREGCVPFGLLTGAKLVKDVARDTAITRDMVELRTDTLLYHLRSIQDELLPPPEIPR